MSYFLPDFHFDNPDKKLTPEWGNKVVHYHVFNSNNRNLLAGKNIREIEEFSSGQINMNPYKRMFTSIRKGMDSILLSSGLYSEDQLKMFDKTALSWEPLPLIPQKLNSACSTVNKIPVEVSCVAQDGLAMKKKKEDIDFLKNKPKVEAELQDIADQMQLGKVDIGSTKHSANKFSEAPMGMDLNDADQEAIFGNLIYSLGVEKANEKALQQMYNITKAKQIKGLEVRDQFKYGVSVDEVYHSSISGLPNIDYVFPGDMEMPDSPYPDFRDTPVRIRFHTMGVMEMFNFFGDEIGSQEKLEEIINGKNGYCACNGRSTVETRNWNTMKINLKCIEVKTVDWVGVKKGSDGSKSMTDNESEASEKIWMQNTIRFWWVVNTKYCFHFERLPWAHREKGKESYQNFSTNVYKSQPKSAVELSIGENKKAQIADIKLEYCLIQSAPAGRYFDLKYMRNALTGLKNENSEWTMESLITMLFERNTFVGDSEGFDGKNEGQMKPVFDLPGGLKSEVSGYISTILNADRNIANFTGINEQLTGQSANPEGLVGLQKLLINSSINAIYYCNEAIESQYEALFNLLAIQLQGCIEEGGKVKEGIVNMIGVADTELLDGLNQTPLHNLTIKVNINQREIERQTYLIKLNRLSEKGVISVTDEYILSGIDNPKERMGYLAIKEKRYMDKQDQIRREGYINQQQLAKQQGENMVASEQAKGQEEIKQIYAKGDVDAKLKQLGNQLGMSQKQIDGLIKMALQKDRNVAQKDKGVTMIREKANIDQQAPLT